MNRFAIALVLIALGILAIGCDPGTPGTGKVIKSAPAGNNLTVTLATPDGVLKHGNAEFTLTFADSSGNPVDVGAVALNYHMPQMGTMQEMNDPSTLTTTDTPGVYHGKVEIEMAGEWQAQITYDGPKGRGKASFSVNAQ